MSTKKTSKPEVSTVEPLKPGPIQRKWLQELKDHPERQLKQELGKKLKNREHRACCLGELLICYNRMKMKKKIWHGDTLQSGEHKGYLQDHWEQIGLRSRKGLVEGGDGLNGYTTLAGMNDGGKTWPEIAEYVEANFENVFTKSI